MRIELRANSSFITGYMRFVQWTPETGFIRTDLTRTDRVYEGGPHRAGPGYEGGPHRARL
jgi:hypothetical protein